MNLNWFDFSIIGVVVLSVIISFCRGFLREIISLITWIAALIFALHFAPTAALWFNNLISAPLLRYIASFVLLFLAVFILGLMVGALVKRGVSAVGLSFVDRLLGAAFGAARGILFVAVILMFITTTAFKNATPVVNSSLSPTFAPLVTWLGGYLPEQLQHVTDWVVLNAPKRKT